MGKEQRNEKMSKKPKKDTSPPKPSSPSDRPTPPVSFPAGRKRTSSSEFTRLRDALRRCGFVVATAVSLAVMARTAAPRQSS